MAKQDITNLENLLTCNICRKIFDEPTILGCGHTFCFSCLTKSTNCPECAQKLCRWRKRTNSKIAIQVKWHLGNEIVKSLKTDPKDKENILKIIKVNMKCAVCCAYVVKAVATLCGHVFCSSCLETWTNSQHQDCHECSSSTLWACVLQFLSGDLDKLSTPRLS
ncbi:tripartite motif-containing protein 12A-like [Macrosteles quadrilineatus]|uniref:tripartite motif-containing protein 12A-like n=1 Tax=Macrosteles quadrilineatus TaxID=74068 RepID=UPI0023E1D03E|nr:tripartite motif-containing protein 12A-like [Macrosteles quadrilineatus]